jgi:hypothetical protein
VFGKLTRAAVCTAEHDGKPMCDEGYADDVTFANLRRAPRLPVEVPRVRTTATPEELRRALDDGYCRMSWKGSRGSWGSCDCASPACENAVRVALAQLLTEHGHDLQGLWVWNLGNRQVRREDRGYAQSGPEMPTVPWFALRSAEVIGGQTALLGAFYYAYPSLAEGADAYWAAMRDHYPKSFAAFEMGDPERAARTLKAEHYFTGDVEAYARDMVDIYRTLAA